jgi:endonuclease/exonuclease/phosphatase family metal-dependent hydrolase
MGRLVARLFLLATLIGGCRAPAPNGNGSGGSSPTASSSTETSSSSSAGGSFAVDLRLGSWNVQDFPKSPQTSTAVSTFIQQQAIHLMAVQEVDNAEAFVQLGEEMDSYATVLNDDKDAFLRLGLLYDSRRIELSDVETIFFDNKHAFPRPPLKARVQAKLKDGSLFDFVVMVVHLKASFDSESEERRRLAIKIIESWISGNLDSPEQHYIVLGDWNDELSDKGSDNVFLPLLNKAGTFTFLTEELENAGQYSFIPSKSFLDHVLITNALLPHLQAPQAMVHNLESQNTNFQQQVSDHRPVTLTLYP